MPDRTADAVGHGLQDLEAAARHRNQTKSSLSRSLSQPQGSDPMVSVPSMKRVSARNADNRLAKSRLKGVSGGRVRRHGGLAGACAMSGHGDAANQCAVVLGESRLSTPRAKLPGLWRVDEMQHDRLEPPFEVKQEKIAHEIEARRERREIALERGVERVLLHERIALGLVAKRLASRAPSASRPATRPGRSPSGRR